MNITIADHIAQYLHFTCPTNNFPASFSEESAGGRRFRFIRTSVKPLMYQVYAADKGIAWGNQAPIAVSIRHPNLFIILVNELQQELFSIEDESLESWPDEVFTALTLFLLDLHESSKEKYVMPKEYLIPPKLIEQEILEILQEAINPNIAKCSTPQEIAMYSEEEYLDKLREMGAANLLKKVRSK